jgi:hypothetical protein
MGDAFQRLADVRVFCPPALLPRAQARSPRFAFRGTSVTQQTQIVARDHYSMVNAPTFRGTDRIARNPEGAGQ